MVWLHFCSPGPTALNRLPVGYLCFLGTELLHVVLVLKVSTLPDPLGEPELWWAGLTLVLSFVFGEKCKPAKVSLCTLLLQSV
jgi:hypothetical protein